MRKLKKVTSAEEKSKIRDIKYRTGFPPPPNFDTVEFTVVMPTVNDEDLDELTIEVDLERF